MNELDDEPNTATLRSNLNAYLIAASGGKKFGVRRYKTLVGILGPVDEMPPEFREDAKRVSFTTSRTEFQSITKEMLRRRAIIITKRKRGALTVATRGRRRRPEAKDRIDFAAIWPLSTRAAISEMAETLKSLTARFETLLKIVRPLSEKLEELQILDKEVESRRKFLDASRPG